MILVLIALSKLKPENLMPTILYQNGFRFFFYTNDHPPMHIHVEKDDKTAKFNLEFIELIRSNKFKAKELKIIRKLVEENAELFKNKWKEFYDNN